jgi:hypothetical protein
MVVQLSILTNLIGIVQINLLPYVGITAQDVICAETIVGEVHGKITKIRANQEITDFISVLPDTIDFNGPVTLVEDIMSMDSLFQSRFCTLSRST